jgi:hypothetical protein
VSAAEQDAPRGFVPMREYLRLQRRVDDLEELLACARSEQRDAASDDVLRALQRSLGVSRQCAQVVAVIATSRRPTITGPEIQRVMGLNSDNHVSVLLAKIAIAQRTGRFPKLIESRHGARGGRWVTPEGREWLQRNVPELFETKGATR